MANRIPLNRSDPNGRAFPWPDFQNVPIALMIPWYFALCGSWLLVANDEPARGWPAAYLTVSALLVFPAQVHVEIARIASRSPRILREVYGEVAPAPGGTRWRPRAALLLAFALPLLLGFG